MEDEVKFHIDLAMEKMEKAIRHLDDELLHIRAGKATPAILDGINVEYYGAVTPLAQVASIGTPDPKTIVIQPWDKTMFDVIEKAILAANIGLTPMNNGEVIRLNFPPLTEERRRNLVKQIRNMAENTRVSVRNARREVMEDFKKLQKDGLAEDAAKDAEHKVQEMTDTYVKKVDALIAVKEKEVMTV
ncbi:MAG: ribosome recycling factor [Bacteroidales bacterium]|mgnify:CR=1 FL=1|nr:ribosome recycling factor [Bacteroidales bacterium]MBN2763273.1 ribosome recycling factor [Bacteroidales bacterium]